MTLSLSAWQSHVVEFKSEAAFGVRGPIPYRSRLWDGIPAGFVILSRIRKETEVKAGPIKLAAAHGDGIGTASRPAV
jgi:hypothetical protein